MPLPHFSNLTMTGSPGGPRTRPQEVVYTNLFEITFVLPIILQAQGRDYALLLQQAKKITGLSALTDFQIGLKEQRFKYSTRQFLTTPSKTSGTIDIEFNVNVNDKGSMETFNTLKAWYDTVWNNATGALHYKSDIIGTIIVNQHDKKGVVLRRVTFQNCQLQKLTYAELDWSQQNIIDTITATFIWDYFIDEYVDNNFTISAPLVYIPSVNE
jgi:hypothetical protein